MTTLNGDQKCSSSLRRSEFLRNLHFQFKFFFDLCLIGIYPIRQATRTTPVRNSVFHVFGFSLHESSDRF